MYTHVALIFVITSLLFELLYMLTNGCMGSHKMINPYYSYATIIIL